MNKRTLLVRVPVVRWRSIPLGSFRRFNRSACGSPGCRLRLSSRSSVVDGSFESRPRHHLPNSFTADVVNSSSASWRQRRPVSRFCHSPKIVAQPEQQVRFIYEYKGTRHIFGLKKRAPAVTMRWNRTRTAATALCNGGPNYCWSPIGQSRVT